MCLKFKRRLLNRLAQPVVAAEFGGLPQTKHRCVKIPHSQVRASVLGTFLMAFRLLTKFVALGWQYRKHKTLVVPIDSTIQSGKIWHLW
ncbi:MAG: hypothetical protein CMJ75_03755 [Planctomycetaceae bacterium]|nr:hypothetical protein [Planctomycetaceae bacterium]